MRWMIMMLVMLTGFTCGAMAAEGVDSATKQPATAEQSKRAPEKIVVKKSDDFFSNIWGQLRKIMPRQNNGVNSSQTTAVMGVRGSEATESALNPYWADDFADDESLWEEMRAYEAAQAKCESGQAAEGIKALDKLLDDTKHKSMKASYTLALGVCQQAAGNSSESKKFLNKFVAEYPDHPMAEDVKRQLSKK